MPVGLNEVIEIIETEARCAHNLVNATGQADDDEHDPRESHECTEYRVFPHGRPTIELSCGPPGDGAPPVEKEGGPKPAVTTNSR